jgi:hypothetical protein
MKPSFRQQRAKSQMGHTTIKSKVRLGSRPGTQQGIYICPDTSSKEDFDDIMINLNKS